MLKIVKNSSSPVHLHVETPLLGEHGEISVDNLCFSEGVALPSETASQISPGLNAPSICS